VRLLVWLHCCCCCCWWIWWCSCCYSLILFACCRLGCLPRPSCLRVMHASATPCFSQSVSQSVNNIYQYWYYIFTFTLLTGHCVLCDAHMHARRSLSLHLLASLLVACIGSISYQEPLLATKP
jgi:hypothetical protein